MDRLKATDACMYRLRYLLAAALAIICCEVRVTASVSTNVPLYHWAYHAIEHLTAQGLLMSDMPGTRPFSRMEFGRLTIEANAQAAISQKLPETTQAALARLHDEFHQEIRDLEVPGALISKLRLKPIEDPYLRFLYGEYPFDKENQSGDVFETGTNWRAGFTIRGTAGDRVAFHLRPEYRDPAGLDTTVELTEGYGTVSVGGLSIQLGRDALWWGPGRHGAMILSKNAEAFTMLKVSNDSPILLPWIFKILGPFKVVYFLTELEEDRFQPNAKFTGLRFNMKPHPYLDIGLSRTIMFGGDNFNISLEDYLQIFWPKNIQGNEDQKAAIDVALRVPMPDPMPFTSMKLYGEYAGEDAAGFSKYVPLLGFTINDICRKGTTDFRFEYAFTHINRFPNTFYQHSLFRSGHTFKGRMMGHHIGTDASDLFMRLSHYITPDLRIGIDFDFRINRRLVKMMLHETSDAPSNSAMTI